MDAQIQNQKTNSQEMQDEKDRKAVSAIEPGAEEPQVSENPKFTVIDQSTFTRYGEKIVDSWTAWDTTNARPGEGVVDQFSGELTGEEVQEELLKRGYTVESRSENDLRMGQDVMHNVEAERTMAVADTRNFENTQNPAPQEHVVTDDKRETIALDPAALERVAAARARDSAQAREVLGLNAIEPNIERQQQQLSAEDDAKRSAWVRKAEPTQSVATEKAAAPINKVESDEIFTASQEEVKPVVPPDIEQQYLRVGDKFYHAKNTDLVAFEDKGNKLETKSNSEAIAESMVRIAEARGWDEIKVSGSEAFRKEVWLEAASRGMHVKGYSPSEQDKAELAKRAASVEANKVEQDNKPFRARENESDKTTAKPADAPKIEPEKPDSPNKKLAQVFATETAVEAVKKHPELAGAMAAFAAMDKKAESDGLTPEQRAVVAARVRQNVMNSIERGDIPQVKVKEEVEVKREAKEDMEFTR